MKENKITLKSNLTKVDKHILTDSDYSEIPELPEEFFTKGRLYKDGQAVERRTQGKQTKLTKKRLSLRLNQLSSFQARIERLRKQQFCE